MIRKVLWFDNFIETVVICNMATEKINQHNLMRNILYYDVYLTQNYRSYNETKNTNNTTLISLSSIIGKHMFTVDFWHKRSYTYVQTRYSKPLSSTWPHLNSDVGLEKGEY